MILTLMGVTIGKHDPHVHQSVFPSLSRSGSGWTMTCTGSLTSLLCRRGWFAIGSCMFGAK